MLRTFLLFIALGPLAASAEGATALSKSTTDALVHVVAHEIGHAFIREFDLPVMGPEEAIADDFATVYVSLTFPGRAADIVAARARQNLADGQTMDRFSEYVDDDRRAARSVCLLYGLDPQRYESLLDQFSIPPAAAAACRDFGPEVGRSWRRLIDAYRLPEDARVTEVRLTGDSLPLTETLLGGPFGRDARRLLTAIDWHSRVTLTIDECDDGAGWSRNGRRITLCDTYVTRFEAQLGN